MNNNKSAVNRIMAHTLGMCFLVLLLLMITDWIGIFNFGTQLKIFILGVGSVVTLTPILFYKLKFNEVFLQYYMHICMSLLIGLMGTNNGIGIYITYVLVPVASCLYFDKKFTIRIGIISYLMMTFGVYMNCAGKMEVIYKNWSHMLTFRNYMIGFTLEYLAVMLFLYQIVKRAKDFMDIQQRRLGDLSEENKRQQEMSTVVKGTMSDSKRTVLEMLSKEMSSFTPRDFGRLASGHQFIAKIQDTLRLSPDFSSALKTVLASVGEYFNIDRILYIEPRFDSQDAVLSYQWTRREEDVILDYHFDISGEESIEIAKHYDEHGFIEITGDGSDEWLNQLIEKDGFVRYMTGHLLGYQLWLPTLVDGEYNGAVCFDKYDTTNMPLVDIFLLSEIVSTLSLFIVRVNADNANRAKSTFLSTMSHEIRTPMNAILGMTTVSLREEMSDTLRKNLSVIRSSSEGLLALINDILDFSKIESGKIDIICENYHILSLVNDVFTIISARNNEKQLELIMDIPEDLPSVLNGDMVRIKQIMVNLATNAVKYTDEGSVTISIKCEKQKNNITLLHFRVTDTGQGIREEDMDHLFESFSQLNQEQNHHKEGTGLGLAISKQLVELMNGSISVQSTFGVGSTFSFYLPQTVVDESPAGNLEQYQYEKEEGEQILFTAPDAKVLIVDDNEINLMVAEALFEPFQMQITLANSGEECLRLLQNNTYDLIFMDHFMPGMDGVEVTRVVRSMQANPNKGVPIIALTADAMAGVKEKMLAEGMNGFLSKPIDIRKASKLIQKYLPKNKIILDEK